MGLTERHWFENEDVPENYERDLEDAVYNSRTNKKHDDDIVRCKDCRWYDEKISFCDNCHLPREQTFFCADGKRRDKDA